MSITAQQLWFTAPQQVEVRAQSLTAPATGEMLVQSVASGISAGTELLVYRGQLPQDMALDASIASMQQQAQFPLQYGYATVGKVIQLGADVDASWLGRFVFAFQPHASHFVTTPAAVIALPAGIAPEAAIFLANMETAVNLVQDGNPGIGERVIVIGQGVVGILLSSVLSQYPLAKLCIVDGNASRRRFAQRAGAQHVCDANSAQELADLKQQLRVGSSDGADLIYEVSGVPEALNTAIDLSGYMSRIVIGSWYGNKTAPVTLGGAAHRNRLQITTSQVSTLAPGLAGRWDKQRRFELAWELIRTLQPQRWITHRIPLAGAAPLYQQLHSGQADILQAVIQYDE
ncbi:MAG: zinc-binding alcohol dehydrogenase [Pseudomonadota bacterium]